MSRPVVSLVRYQDAYEDLKEAFRLCNGFANLKKNDKILIKPNLVGWEFDYPIPPFGMVATSALLFALVKILTEEGYGNLTIGEGPIMIPRTMGWEMFKMFGYEKLQEDYGVELVDFNEGRFEDLDFGDFKLSVAEKALRADKIINLPVLKTHNQTKVSLGVKNLKGVLNKKSKMFCHGESIYDLHKYFPHLLEKLPLALTIIDGIFVLERGPSYTGTAYRKNLLIASTDPLACDVVGADLMGYRPEEVTHLKYAADLWGRSSKMEDIEVVGEAPEEHRQDVEHDFAWTPENTGPMGFKKRGITGLAVRKYDNTLCTGCSISFTPVVVLLMSSFTGAPFPGIEVLTGKTQKASPGFEKTVLYGRCACHANEGNTNIKKAIEIKGCPPNLDEFMKKLEKEGIKCNLEGYAQYREYLYNRYQEKDGFALNFYREQSL